jgi:hypothetical protein
MTITEALEKLGIEFIGDTNRMTTDEVLRFFDLTVDDDGEIIDAAGKATGIWYEEII